MATERMLIVNADDFGQSAGVNRGIIEAHEHGIVTSASLMVRWPAAQEAAEYARRHPELSLGIHFDFAEWACRNGEWRKLYEVVPVEDAKAVAREAARQLAAFRRLVGREPTHIDSHQHHHRQESLRPIFDEMAEQMGIPLRSCSPQVRYCGDFYGQDDRGTPYPELISPEALIRLLTDLPPGCTELGCHPGLPEGLDSMYLKERAIEVKTLCDAKVRAAIDALGLELRTFGDVPAARDSHTRAGTAA
jgi:chitin disaccharide deacetylase